jgi:hypothetical protein
MRRHTFVVQVHTDGISTLENLSTSERVRISDFGTVGRQIEAWLAEENRSRSSAPQQPPPRTERALRESTPE